MYKAATHLLAISSEGNKEKTVCALDDWYLSETKNYEKFAAKYPMNGQLQSQSAKMAAMDNWRKAVDIKFTPTIFVNGKQLPDTYSIEDLQYFLLE